MENEGKSKKRKIKRDRHESVQVASPWNYCNTDKFMEDKNERMLRNVPGMTDWKHDGAIR